MIKMTALILAFLTVLNFSCADIGKNPTTAEEAHATEGEEIKSEAEVKVIVDLPAKEETQVNKMEDKTPVEVEEVASTVKSIDKSKEPSIRIEENVQEEEPEVLIGDLNAEDFPIRSEEVIEVVDENIGEVEKEDPVIREPDVVEILEEVIAKPDHTAFNALLSKYVSSTGKVNYDGIKSSIASLDAYLADLESNPVASDWSRNEKLAYWINAYNAYTIKLILNNYPVSSITKIAGGKPWDKKWINIGGKTYSLNNIENDIIRPQFNEPRIHFAVNCAALSCPPLANKAFTAGNLNSLLEKQTKAFINNSKYNTITGGSVSVSKIFDWYGKDFGDLKAFLNKYSSSKIAAATEVGFSDYDWALNNK